MKITIATCAELPDLIPEDAHLIEALKERGATIKLADWRGDFAPFAQADLVLIRTIWDYYQHAEQFNAWLDRLAASKATICNDIELMRWNMNKRYLITLKEAGAPLPRMFVSSRDAQQIFDQLNQQQMSDVVIKPVLSAGSDGLSHLVSPSLEDIKTALAKIDYDVLVQDFLPEIQSIGETSLVYFNGEFSHAALKRPPEGEIRCQEEYGGLASAQDVPQAAIEQGAEILKMLPSAPLYARVDVILKPGEVVLMEVELIEPELFFRFAPQSASLFADFVLDAVQ